MQVVKTSKTKDRFLCLCLRNIWLLTAIYDIDLHVDHIAASSNVITDTLSRIHSENPVNQAILRELEHNYIWETVKITHFNLNKFVKFQIHSHLLRIRPGLLWQENLLLQDLLPFLHTKHILRLTLHFVCLCIYHCKFFCIHFSLFSSSCTLIQSPLGL